MMSDPLFNSYLSVPWKAVYVRRKKDPNKCLLCAIVQKIRGVKSWEVFRDDLVMVLLNRFPYNPGHLLISPLEHYEEYEAMPSELTSHLSVMLQRGIKLLKMTHQPMGFNIGLNLGGNIAGGSIKHIHWHLVPRYIGDLNFMEMLGTRVLIETLEETLSILKGDAEKSFSFED
jgi:ATP adenylyltransferase